MVVPPLAPEIIWFTPSDEYLDDPEQILAAINKSSANNGLIGSYHGFRVIDNDENDDMGVWVMAWQTLAHQQRFMSDESYVDFIMPVMDSMAGPGEITQVLLTDIPDFNKAVSSPITQFIYITLRPRHDRSYELVPLIEKLCRELKVIPGCYASCWGPSVEHDNVEVGVVGWKSIADRDNAVRGRLAPIILLIRELSKVELRYARLTTHSLLDFQ